MLMDNSVCYWPIDLKNGRNQSFLWGHLSASSPACNGFLEFTSGVTPTNILVASMAAKPFVIHTHTYAHTIGGTCTWESSLLPDSV